MDVKVAIKPAEPFSKSRIYGCEKFKELVLKLPLRIPTRKSESLEDMLLVLSDVIAMRIEESVGDLTNTEHEVTGSSKLLDQLSSIGWQNIIKADHKSGHFIMRLDAGGKFTLDCSIFNGMYCCSIDPPLGEFSHQIFSSIAEAYKQASARFHSLSDFCAFIQRCKDIFHLNELTDGRMEVLKSPGCWITLKFDHSNLHQKPESDGIDILWNTTIDPIENMKINFPMVSDLVLLECGVCSSTKDSTGNWPDYHCSSPDCNQPFHQACLLEWFLADPRSIKSFGQTHGACPFCEHVNVLEN